MLAALELLATLPGRHVAVLGEMLELGDAHERGHVEVGEAAARQADLVVVVGASAAGIARGAASLGEAVVAVADREAALAVLRERLRSGDSVLVKASRGVALEWIVESLAGGIGGQTSGPSSGPAAASGSKPPGGPNREVR
jgi:UDP-N-acetylmuramoyl-tripeptide--D-alanyl-D-alanine ligase